MVRDHIIPLAEGGEDSQANTGVKCHDCHDAKTQQERTRGIRRAGG
jgi:5-methylcytosine-specific restriction protein A